MIPGIPLRWQRNVTEHPARQVMRGGPPVRSIGQVLRDALSPQGTKKLEDRIVGADLRV